MIAVEDWESNRISACKLWFEFLKLGSRENCTEKVIHDFGDVWSLTFEEWWPNHSYLFKPLERFGIDVIETANEFDSYVDDQNMLVIVVNLLETKKTIKADFGRLIDERMKTLRGSPEYEDNAWHHSFVTRPNVPGLMTILAVYKCWREDLQLSKLQIAQKLKLVEIADGIARQDWKENDAPKIVQSREKVQVDTVDRHLRQAKALIANVERGLFPKSDYN